MATAGLSLRHLLCCLSLLEGRGTTVERVATLPSGSFTSPAQDKLHARPCKPRSGGTVTPWCYDISLLVAAKQVDQEKTTDRADHEPQPLA